MKDTIYPEIEKYVHCSLILLADRLLLDLDTIKPSDLARVDVSVFVFVCLLSLCVLRYVFVHMYKSMFLADRLLLDIFHQAFGLGAC